MQHTRRWSQVRLEPVPQEQLQHLLSQMPSVQPGEHFEYTSWAVIETPQGRLDARLETQLAALERALTGGARG